MAPQQFIDAYLERTENREENPWQTRTKPCPFLKENRCSVYEDRPADCSGYPYLYEPDFVFRTMGMIERTFTCPIVYQVTEELTSGIGDGSHWRLVVCEREKAPAPTTRGRYKGYTRFRARLKEPFSLSIFFWS